MVAATLFIIDGVFFTLTMAQRSYFQKIGDPADMAATASVAFTINHIAAGVIPVALRHARDDQSVNHLLARRGDRHAIAWLAFLVPTAPEAGRETVLAGPRPAPAE